MPEASKSQTSPIEPANDFMAKTQRQPSADAAWLAECPLADGSVVRFRHVSADDQPLITEAIRTASRETLLHRFFSPIRSVAPDQLRSMLVIDRTRDLCVVGVVEAGGDTRIVCGARYVRLARPEVAEIAFTVHDDFQHRGLGRFLLKLVAQMAARDGIRWFEADVMTSNEKMLNLFRKGVARFTESRRLGDVQHLAFEVSAVVSSKAQP